LNNNSEFKIGISISILLFCFLYFFIRLEILEAAAYAFALFFIGQIFFSTVNSFPVFNIMLLFPWLQWVIAPIVSFYFPSENLNYNILQSKTEYLAFALPGTVLYSLGIFSFLRSTKISKLTKELANENKEVYSAIGIKLIVVGLVSFTLRSIVPGSIAFFLFILSGLQYVGVYYIIFSKWSKKIKLMWLLIVYGFLLIQNILQGSFQEIILWAISLYLFIGFLFRFNTVARIASFTVAIVFIAIIQLVKGDYREKKDAGRAASSGSLALFYNTVNEKDLNKELIQNDNLASTIVRFNQGWIISRILDHTPRSQPYGGGETIQDAIMASIFPRFLFESKVQSGGEKNFSKYTGVILNRTSMDLSPLGESYANFGIIGGFVCIFLIGSLFSYIIYSVINLSINQRIEIIFWLPLILLQSLKAESDFATGLNHITKSSLIVFIVLKFFLKNTTSKMKDI
jgi:hypothetical protein